METQKANVFPIFYIKYNNDNELANAIKVLTEQYCIKFSEKEDKRYPFNTDFDDFKQLVIECVQAISNEQIQLLLQTFVPFGQDLLYNSSINSYVSFVGDSGVDLTKSLINTYRNMELDNKRNLSDTPIAIKPVQATPEEDLMTITNIIEEDTTNMMNEEVIKEVVESKQFYVKLKIAVYTDSDKDDCKKILSKQLKIKFSSDDIEQFADADTVGINYYTISLTEPIDADKVQEIISNKDVKNFANGQLYFNPAQAYISFFDGKPNTDGVQPKNITKVLFARNMNTSEDSICEGFAMVDNLFNTRTLRG